MKVLLTGGAGFIGSHLTDKLLDEGNQVVCLDNLDPYYDVNLKIKNIRRHENNNDYIFKEGDIRDKELVSFLFETNKIDLVIHIAAKAGVRPSLSDPQLYYDVNVMGTLNILENMRTHDVKKLIFASSSSVYGNNLKVPFSVKDSVDNPISPYASSKKTGELLCYNYHHLYDIDITCLRFFTVYGPRQRPEMAISNFVHKIYNGITIDQYGDGSSKRDYTYVSDIVTGVMLSIENCEGYKILNLGESKTISLKEMIALIEKIVDKKAIINKLPNQAGDVNITYADISDTTLSIGYKPTVNMEQGISQYFQWYKKSLAELNT